jgi:hypothetical protein
MNRRTRIYRVIYDALPTGKPSNHLDTLPTGNGLAHQPTNDALPKGETDAQIVCPPNSQAPEKPAHSDDIYIPLNGNRFCETETNSPKGHLPLRVGDGLRRRNADNDGAFLAIVERELKAGASLDLNTQKQIEAIAESFDSTEPLACQANRILEEWGHAA